MYVRVESQYVPMNHLAFSSARMERKNPRDQKLYQLYQEMAAVPQNSGEMVAARAGKGQYLFIAVDTETGLPVGLASCVILKVSDADGSQRGYGMINGLAVLPRFRRKGVASAILQDMIARMKNENVLRVSLITDSLDFLQVTMSSALNSARQLFEAVDFKLARSNGEVVYIYPMNPKERKLVGHLKST